MIKGNILIVDDEEDVCFLIKDRLVSMGYDADYVLNGQSALDYVKQKRPDLILLDIMMPDMDGYEVAKRLISHEGVSTVPIIMLTALNSQRDKLKALTMGIDDYITKPFDFDELIARIQVVIRRAQKEKRNDLPAKVSRPSQKMTLEDEARLKLLKEMIQTKNHKLEPVYGLNSEVGYVYPFAANILNTKNGFEILDLDILAERQCLAKDFFDKILTCPFCKNYNLNIRETCTACHSAHIKVVDMLHHFRCAYTGMEDEFKQGIDYICPKCHKELKNIGVDYDKPGQDYYCEACSHLSTEALTNAQCRQCLQIFEVENALRQNIYTYQITQQGILSVEQGSFTDIQVQDSWMDEETDVYNLRYLRSLLALEFKQAQHFKRTLSLVLLGVENFKEILQEKGEVLAKKLIKRITAVFKEHLRDVDIPARFQENILIAMLLECDKVKAANLMKKVGEEIEKTLSGEFGRIILSLKVVTFPEDAKTEDSLLKTLLENKTL